MALTVMFILPPPPCGVNVTESVEQLDATEVVVQVSCAETMLVRSSGTSEEKMRIMVFFVVGDTLRSLGAWVTTQDTDFRNEPRVQPGRPCPRPH